MHNYACFFQSLFLLNTPVYTKYCHISECGIITFATYIILLFDMQTLVPEAHIWWWAGIRDYIPQFTVGYAYLRLS